MEVQKKKKRKKERRKNMWNIFWMHSVGEKKERDKTAKIVMPNSGKTIIVSKLGHAFVNKAAVRKAMSLFRDLYSEERIEYRRYRRYLPPFDYSFYKLACSAPEVERPGIVFNKLTEQIICENAHNMNRDPVVVFLEVFLESLIRRFADSHPLVLGGEALEKFCAEHEDTLLKYFEVALKYGNPLVEEAYVLDQRTLGNTLSRLKFLGDKGLFVCWEGLKSHLEKITEIAMERGADYAVRISGRQNWRAILEQYPTWHDLRNFLSRSYGGSKKKKPA